MQQQKKPTNNDFGQSAPEALADSSALNDTDSQTMPNPLDENHGSSQKEDKSEKKRRWPFGGFLSVVQLFVGAFLLAFIINRFAFQSYEVFGQSMTPTLNDGDRLVISKLSKSWSQITPGNYQPERGDIIVFNSPRNPEIQLIKRVIGLPGERVVVTNGNITIYNDANSQGFDPDLPYKEHLALTQGDVDVLVPKDELFVAGDNRTQGGSLDSRNELGTVPIENVAGKLLLRIFPISDFQAF